MKKALLVIAVVAVVLIFRIWPHTPRAAEPSARQPPATPSTVIDQGPAVAPSDTPASSSRPYSTTTEANRAWEPVVEGFALAYPDTRGLTRPEWLASLRPYLTPGILKALAITDLDKVPDGHYAGYEILRQADETVTVRALYREGWAIDLYLTQIRSNVWRILTLVAVTV